MFTGLVWGTAVLSKLQAMGGDVRLEIHDVDGVLATRAHALGDSIALNGVCLTLVAQADARLAFDVSNETLALTTLGSLEMGALINVEAALTLATPLGGHLVSGHVDGIGRVAQIQPDGRASRWRFELPTELAPYLARKGSVAVDGVSLTVNQADAQGFEVALIPHTIERTRFRALQPGAAVNIEVDLIARYAERLLSAGRGN